MAIEPTAAGLAAMSQVRKLSAQFLLETAPFNGRRFTDRTIRAMVDCSIDAPERLLFMTEDQLRKIPGIGKASMAEIKRYRERFIK